MLYELIAVVRPGSLSNVREIASSIGSQILAARGVIRGLRNWGQFDLPRPTTKHQNQNFQGHYFVMQFDSSIATLNGVKRQLSLDPRMIRFSVVKMADKLGRRNKSGTGGGVESVDGDIGWTMIGGGKKQSEFEAGVDSWKYPFLASVGRR
ncbi:hypothetical protein DV736_g3205, partial [Chaetothyriales sp. CBS 134916]